MKIQNKYRLSLLIFLFFISSIKSQPVRQLNSSEFLLALKKLNVLGSALYIAAHPDDENTALLTYLSNKKLLRTAYLSLTRGDGGQNLIGNEQGELLGILRTQELLAAREIDGAKQYFTRAIDFGYSKTPEESIDIWNRQQVLSDIVLVIRKFRPDVIITRFTPDLGGHGHHRASAMLAVEAFKLAGDATKFPEQLNLVDPWQPKRVVWNAWRPALERDSVDLSTLSYVDLGEFNSLLGESYGKLAAKSRTMHKSQGFGWAGWRGSYREYFTMLVGDSIESDLFEDINLTWSKVPGGEGIEKMIRGTYHKFQPENPAALLPDLLRIYSKMRNLPDKFWLKIKRKEVLNLIQSAAGLWMEAMAKDYLITPGNRLTVDIMVVNRCEFPLKLNRVGFPFNKPDSVIEQSLTFNLPVEFKTTLQVPENAAYTKPYWLENPAPTGMYQVPDLSLRGLPENPVVFYVDFEIQADDEKLNYKVPVKFSWVDPVEGEKFRRVEIVPPVVAKFDEDVYFFGDENSGKVIVNLQRTVSDISGNLKLERPENWKINPDSYKFNLNEEQKDLTVSFTVTPPVTVESTTVTATTDVIKSKNIMKMVTMDYPHIQSQTALLPLRAKFIRAEISGNKGLIGYIMGSGDDIPQHLRQLGYEVELLDQTMLDKQSLSKYKAIITGIRAYNTNDWLVHNHSHLLEYVYHGGTLLMQYNVTRGLIMKDLGPYPFQLSRDRVTDEEAPISMISPNHPLLNYPNKISSWDFDGWVQERGLYFPNEWNSKYQTVISCSDPGEDSKEGGLLFARYGKGSYIYCAYAFFRQLPAGVPGAYRLITNLISVGEYYNDKATTN